ncbi:MAG: ATP-dependent DNA ligase [Methanoregulaceae archaeon]|jgi:bifunctional non-homologous end joining protein LigD|nr:ATP-dependent DNA ligase [Methanoregulaceae archaeon]MCU0628187.1 ATP-dependent DNA ligase [Methanoregulaceae archaeon]
MGLEEYKEKRNFKTTPEPHGKGKVLPLSSRIFVVQEHHATHLHYDIRLESEGVLRSWAVPKGIPEKPGERHLAVETEDHPLEYAGFEGTIPEGEYGAGAVKIWDSGIFEPLVWEKDKIEVVLKGDRLAGRYVLVRFKRAGEKDWLIFRAKE